MCRGPAILHGESNITTTVKKIRRVVQVRRDCGDQKGGSERGIQASLSQYCCAECLAPSRSVTEKMKRIGVLGIVRRAALDGCPSCRLDVSDLPSTVMLVGWYPAESRAARRLLGVVYH